mgnify:CR=1 FL=1
MFELKNEKIAIPVVLFAGLVWSFGPLVVRYMDQPELVPFQYIFARGMTIFVLINIYLYLEEGKKFYKNYLKIGWSGIVGGVGLGTAIPGVFFGRCRRSWGFVCAANRHVEKHFLAATAKVRSAKL